MKRQPVNPASLWAREDYFSARVPHQRTGLCVFQSLVRELVLSKFPSLLAKIWVTRGRAVENLINLRIYFLARGGKKKKSP